MKYSTHGLQAAMAILAYISCAEAETTKDKRQVGQTGSVDTGEDRQPAETAFANAGIIGGGKYFQYAHEPSKDHYQFGHKKGNDHHFNERHEKANLHAGEFKTKVRWGDKHGGYGEHYWDYNHGGDAHSGEETQDEPQYAAYEDATEEKPQYVQRSKRQPYDENSDVEFIDPAAKKLVESGRAPRHGGNYKTHPDYERTKRNDVFSNLVFDPATGRIIDGTTGQIYELKPIN